MVVKVHSEMLTVAAIRKSKRRGPTEYLFNEKQQIFTFEKGKKRDEEAEYQLTEAFKKKRPVKVSFDLRRGRIRSITAPTRKQQGKFLEERKFLKKPSKPRKLRLGKIDPTKFNIVDYYLKFPPFQRCQKIVPSYTKAKQIFDYCADQSCHLPGPYGISPCIPFQYVRDGCYARAHKMRRIITKDYGYCCEKVFSFANQNNDVLAVTADKWGGCCVTWWYHVAPLIRVRIKLSKLSKKSLTLAMVIDPSMFDKPVLLSSWLYAQEKTVCNANANVSMYSIQPGSAYSPANYSGTAFATDPSYTATDSTLLAYSGLVTC